jgi:hypothetical protein
MMHRSMPVTEVTRILWERYGINGEVFRFNRVEGEDTAWDYKLEVGEGDIVKVVVKKGQGGYRYFQVYNGDLTELASWVDERVLADYGRVAVVERRWRFRSIDGEEFEDPVPLYSVKVDGEDVLCICKRYCLPGCIDMSRFNLGDVVEAAKIFSKMLSEGVECGVCASILRVLAETLAYSMGKTGLSRVNAFFGGLEGRNITLSHPDLDWSYSWIMDLITFMMKRYLRVPITASGEGKMATSLSLLLLGDLERLAGMVRGEPARRGVELLREASAGLAGVARELAMHVEERRPHMYACIPRRVAPNYWYKPPRYIVFLFCVNKMGNGIVTHAVVSGEIVKKIDDAIVDFASKVYEHIARELTRGGVAE